MPSNGQDDGHGPGSAFPVVIVGTRAQLIKVAPVLLEMERRHVGYRLVFTGQHLVTMEELLADFGVRQEPVWLTRKREIDTLGKILPWFLATLWRLTLSQRSLLKGPDNRDSLVIVHGDTISTLLGALAGRLNRHRVAHIESGLRSFDWRHPFPEELTRILVFRLINIAFCPGQWAAGNMAGYGVEIVDTGANTLLDSVRKALSAPFASPGDPVAKPYCVASIHRFENLRSSQRLNGVLKIIREAARSRDVVFVLHPSTRARLESTGELARLEDVPGILLRERMGYMSFMQLLSGAEFVLTDGGSNQEELSYLGVPTLIVRDKSERPEGLNRNAELVKLKGNDWRDTLESIKARGDSDPVLQSARSPSRTVVNRILAPIDQAGTVKR